MHHLVSLHQQCFPQYSSASAHRGLYFFKIFFCNFLIKVLANG